MQYPLVISKEDLDIIAAALGELPFKHAFPVFQRIQAQCVAFEASQKPADAAATVDEPEMAEAA